MFGQLLKDAALSPGQLYLLRVAVACYCNNDNQNLVFLLDEPELHLHPQAQIELVKTLRQKFQNAQFWISAQCTDPPETLPAAGEETVSGLRYFAYDVDDKDAVECKAVMSRCGVSLENYFNHQEPLLKTVGGQADYVLLVNVLHEIDPRYWIKIFSTIRSLLKDTGHLVIVEREELTIGETPYNNGFLMITEDGAQKLFGVDNCVFVTHPQKTYIVKHIIKQEGLEVTDSRLKECLLSIKDSAYQKIGEIKRGRAENNIERYRMGIQLAFCLHQYANASLNCDAVAAATEVEEGKCHETAGAIQ